MSSADRKGRSILLTGYFDRGNLGDDWMRDGLKELFTSLGYSVLERCLQRPSFDALRDLRSTARETDAVVLAGGSHFDSADGAIRQAKSFAKFAGLSAGLTAPLQFVGVGLETPARFSATVLRVLLSNGRLPIITRDRQSLETVGKIAPRADRLLGADPALASSTARSLSRLPPPAGHNLLVVPAVRPHTQISDRQELLRAVAAQVERDVPDQVTVGVTMSDDRYSDLDDAEQLVSRLNSDGIAVNIRRLTMASLLETIRDHHVVVAQRYHVLLATLVGGRTAIPCSGRQREQRLIGDLAHLTEQCGSAVRLMPEARAAVVRAGHNQLSYALRASGW